MHGQDLFVEAMAYCAARMPRGAVSGEIIAGVEPIERTLEGIDRIAARPWGIIRRACGKVRVV